MTDICTVILLVFLSLGTQNSYRALKGKPLLQLLMCFSEKENIRYY